MNVNSMNIGQLSSLLEGAQVDISFLGERRVYLSNNQGSIPLHLVADRLFALGEECILQNFSIADRKTGHLLKEKLVKMYEQTDEQIKNVNLITYIFHSIRYWYGREGWCFKEGDYGVFGYQKNNYVGIVSCFEHFQGYKDKGWFLQPHLSKKFEIQGKEVECHYYPQWVSGGLFSQGTFCIF